ncbi:hypothetical protein GO594_12980 [Pseudomonas otitidis]|uniref:Uncharacterized protein n=1 Tax=Metapseudomonas otitidis TaxID=319939 RepID=A0A7X3H9B8_9GAMM|nr:hypothetical protein [Pseudomonas otitidis]MWK56894.1 hypothetical protein [Pseudomonas otitidis]
MANRLSKVPAVRNIPGTPGVPAIPAYCVDVPVFSDFGAYANNLQLMASLTQMLTQQKLGNTYYGEVGIDASGRPLYGPKVVGVPPEIRDMFVGAGGAGGPLVWYYEKRCYPATPAVPAVPPKVVYDALPGWNSGGQSIGGLLGDGYAQFIIGPSSIGAVVGLNSRSDTVSPADCSHAFYGHQGALDIYEGGVVVQSVATPLSARPVLRVARSKGIVQYLVDGVVVRTSPTRSTGFARLDVSLYAAGDFVEDPLLANYNFGTASGRVGITASFDRRPRAEGRVGVSGYALGRVGDRRYSSASGRVGIQSSAVGHTLNHSSAAVDIGIEGQATPAANGGVGTFRGGYLGIGGDRAYAQGVGVYRGGYQGEGRAGFPEISFSYGVGYGPKPLGTGRVISGGVGRGSGVAAAAQGVGGEHGYAQGVGVYRGGYIGIGYAPWLDSSSAQFSEPVLVRDTFSLGADLQASFISTVTVGDDVLLEVEITEGLEWFETIFAGSLMAEQGDVDLAFADQVLVSTQSNIPQLEGIQYASNILTGAITRYSNFDFLAIGRTPYGSFGVREDGIYRIAPGDDDGDTVDMQVDFGATDYGTNQLKRVDAVYFGLCTDGQVLAVLRADDGAEHTYKVVSREPTLRATTAKGVTGRSWRLKLKIYAASQAELATVETSVAASSRRLS